VGTDIGALNDAVTFTAIGCSLICRTIPSPVDVVLTPTENVSTLIFVTVSGPESEPLVAGNVPAAFDEAVIAFADEIVRLH
jgi:hypothetical protein